MINIKFIDTIRKRLFFYIPVIIVYTFIVYSLKKHNHFFGLNENSTAIDCMYYASIVFTGSGYGEIYPQTRISRIIILSLSIVKLFIIIYPIESINDTIILKNGEISLEKIYNEAQDVLNISSKRFTVNTK